MPNLLIPTPVKRRGRPPRSDTLSDAEQYAEAARLLMAAHGAAWLFERQAAISAELHMPNLTPRQRRNWELALARVNQAIERRA